MIEFAVSGVETYWWLPGMVAFAISFFVSMAGLSGAFILMPFQISILGFSSIAVTPTNLVYNLFSIPGGTWRFIREKRMVWRLALVIILGTVPGMVIGAYLRARFLLEPRQFKLFVGLVLFYILIRLIKSMFKKGDTKKQTIGTIESESFTISRCSFKFQGKTYSISTLVTLLLSFAVGIISGAYGIGGGAIVAPFLVAVAGFPVYTIAGVSLFSTLIASLAGVIIYMYVLPALSPAYPAVSPDWLLGLSMGIGGFIGIYLGARCQKHVPSGIIKVILAISLGIVVVKYIGGYFLNF